MMSTRIPITTRGAEKLKAELDYLKKTARPNVVAAIAEAREKGDLSENAEYDAAREEPVSYTHLTLPTTSRV